jgi:ABC-2 type transport system ATP-binding protein
MYYNTTYLYILFIMYILVAMQPAISLDNISRSFRDHFWTPKKTVIRGISLEIQQGEVFGFLGPNGAGKTTTIKIITGLIRPDTGQAQVLGEPAGTIGAKKKIGFLQESPYFYEHLTGYEFLNIHARLTGIQDVTERVDELLSLVGLEQARNQRLALYSRGMLQRIGIAQALLGDPQVLILDEPLSGLDPIGRKEIKDIILQEKEKGKTIFFSSHILPDAEAICDRVGIIINGEIKETGELDMLLKKSLQADRMTLEDWFYRQITDRKKT